MEQATHLPAPDTQFSAAYISETALEVHCGGIEKGEFPRAPRKHSMGTLGMAKRYSLQRTVWNISL